MHEHKVETHFHLIARFFEKELDGKLLGVCQLDIRGATPAEALQRAKDYAKGVLGYTNFRIDQIIEHDHPAGGSQHHI